jgi:Fe-S oxidoreductase
MVMEIVSPYQEGIDAVKQAGGEFYKYCYQCGMCNTVCPWNKVRIYSMRTTVRQAAFGVPEIDGDDMWLCTTCGKCPQRCPRGVGTMDVAISFRRIASEAGINPGPISPVKASLAAEGNPLGEARATRGDWAKNLNVKTFTEGTDILYFPGCYLSYEPRLKKVAAATVDIFNKAGVDFGILGARENCCGESVRKTGAEDLFKLLAKENIKTWVDAGVKKIVVSSPHCYHTFKNEYTQLFKVNFEVMHITQFLYQLLREGKIKLTKEVAKTITYHDPCYLGRHNNIFDEPREVLKMVPGIKLVEMSETRVDSLCCGGGGGRVWLDTPKKERFSDIRVQQAIDTGAQTLVTACPYCITLLEASKLTLDAETTEIKDITEIIQEAL